MDYPTRKRKTMTGVPAFDEANDRRDLKLAEFSAPFGEESPWREGVVELNEALDARLEFRPARGHLH